MSKTSRMCQVNQPMSVTDALKVLQDVKKMYPLTLGSGQYYSDKCRRGHGLGLGGENNDEQYDDAA